MIPLRLLPYGIAVVLMAGGGFYIHQRAFNRGEAKIQAQWDAEKAIQVLAYEKQLTENARLQNERDLIRWKHEDALKQKLAADLRASDLSRRLREHYAGRGPVSEASDATGDPFGTGGNGVEAGRVDAALGDILAACQRDAIRLNGWIQWWEEVSRE